MEAANADMRLDELDLGENELSSQEVQVIAGLAATQELKVLRVDTMHCDVAGFFDAPFFKSSLRYFSAENPGDSNLLGVLLASAPEQLHSIHMTSEYGWSEVSGIGDILADTDPVPSILHLNLGGCTIEEDELESIGKALPNLLSLDLSNMWEEEFEGDLTGFALSPLYAQLLSFKAISPKDKPAPIEPPVMKLGRWNSHEL